MTDHEVRLAAFAFLEEQTALHDDIIPYQTLLEGFAYEGHRVPLVPLIHLYGIVVGEYLPIWPVYGVGFDDAALGC